MNRFAEFLEDLGALASVVIILALMAVLCALGFVVLVIAGFVVAFIGVMSNPKERTLSINPILTIGVAVVTFSVSFAAIYFVAVFTVLLGVLFGISDPDSTLLMWIRVWLFLVIQFVLIGAGASFFTFGAARFHFVHHLAAAGLYLGIWYVYARWSGPSAATLPVWVDYVEYASVFCGVIMGSIVGKMESSNHSETLDQ